MISHPFSRWLECFFCTPDSIWIHLPWKLTGLSHAKCSPQLSQGRSTTELTALLSLQYVCGCLQIWNPVFNTGLISFLTRTSRYWYDLSCLHSLFADHPAFCSFSVLHIHCSPKPRFRAFALPTFFFFFKGNQLLLSSSFPTYYPFSLSSSALSWIFPKRFCKLQTSDKPLSNRHTNVCILKEQSLLHYQEKEGLYKVFRNDKMCRIYEIP